MINDNSKDGLAQKAVAATGSPSLSSRRLYAAPQLEHYGTLAELTQQQSTKTPGDGLGASFAS